MNEIRDFFCSEDSCYGVLGYHHFLTKMHGDLNISLLILLILLFVVLVRDTACSSEAYHTTWCNNPENCSMSKHEGDLGIWIGCQKRIVAWSHFCDGWLSALVSEECQCSLSIQSNNFINSSHCHFETNFVNCF